MAKVFHTQDIFLGTLYTIDQNGLQDDLGYSLLERVSMPNQCVTTFRIIRRDPSSGQKNAFSENTYVTDRSIAPDHEVGRLYATGIHAISDFIYPEEIRTTISINKAIMIQNRLNRYRQERINTYRGSQKRLVNANFK